MTLHDEWTYTGHCAYTMGCERWRTGCGSCPDLTIYPAVRRDATHANRERKQSIYEHSRLYVTTPSQWLMGRAQASILAPGVVEWKVIPNGVDRSIFRPADRAAARAQLDLPQDAAILLFAANAARRNRFKDLATVSGAAKRAAIQLDGRTVICIVLGDSGASEPFENGELRFIPFLVAIEDVAAYFRAADIYLHAANADNLPRRSSKDSRRPPDRRDRGRWHSGGGPESGRRARCVVGCIVRDGGGDRRARGTRRCPWHGGCRGENPQRRLTPTGPLLERSGRCRPQVRLRGPARRDDRLVPGGDRGLARAPRDPLVSMMPLTGDGPHGSVVETGLAWLGLVPRHGLAEAIRERDD